LQWQTISAYQRERWHWALRIYSLFWFQYPWKKRFFLKRCVRHCLWDIGGISRFTRTNSVPVRCWIIPCADASGRGKRCEKYRLSSAGKRQKNYSDKCVEKAAAMGRRSWRTVAFVPTAARALCRKGKKMRKIRSGQAFLYRNAGYDSTVVEIRMRDKVTGSYLQAALCQYCKTVSVSYGKAGRKRRLLLPA
jgi:hypothetical protein